MKTHARNGTSQQKTKQLLAPEEIIIPVSFVVALVESLEIFSASSSVFVQ